MRARGLKLLVRLDVVELRLQSRPVRARGLKPLVGAVNRPYVVSRPVRARGLKPIITLSPSFRARSRPVRARGLKQREKA